MNKINNKISCYRLYIFYCRIWFLEVWFKAPSNRTLLIEFHKSPTANIDILFSHRLDRTPAAIH